MIRAEGISKFYEESGIWGLSDLSLTVGRGELFCMLGANGAGKTTFMMICLGFLKATKGKLFINNLDVDSHLWEIRKLVSYVAENVSLYDNFTVLQNLSFFAKLSRNEYSHEEIIEILRRVNFPEKAYNRRFNQLSKGMRQRVGIAIALAKNSQLMFLDEPTSGLDPKGANELIDLIIQLRNNGTTIFMSTHDIFRANSVADRIGIMCSGNLLKVIDSAQKEKVNLEKLYIDEIDNHLTRVLAEKESV